MVIKRKIMGRGAKSLTREFHHPDTVMIKFQDLIEKKTRCSTELKKRYLARTNFSCFVKYVNPDFFMGKFHSYLCKQIDEMIRTNVWIAVSCPPRHGKSELISRLLPAYLLGRDPSRNYILCSYSQSLACKNMRDALRIMTSPSYKILFPKTIIPTKQDKNYMGRQDFTELVHPENGNEKYGSLKACGVGSSLTGFGGSLICDDLVKDRDEADSEVVREKTQEWYAAVARTRLNDAKDFVLLVGTRFHPNDVIGNCINNKTGDVFKEIRLPAIAEENDLLGRKIGEALWADKFPEKELYKIRESIGASEFNCLYQQSPIAIGNLWFNFNPVYTDLMLPKDNRRQGCVIGVDPALGSSKNGDYSSIVVTMRDSLTKKIYIDSFHYRCKVDELILRICEIAENYQPDAICIEKNNFQSLILNPLQDALLKRGIYTRLMGVNNSVNKQTRILRLGAYLPSMLFYNSDMNKILTTNIQMLPQTNHDDPADACEQSIRGLIEICNSRVAVV